MRFTQEGNSLSRSVGNKTQIVAEKYKALYIVACIIRDDLNKESI